MRASNPAAAISAAKTPLNAALPAWNGFAIEPNDAVNPLTWVAVKPRAFLTAFGLNFASTAAAAVAPKLPKIPVA